MAPIDLNATYRVTLDAGARQSLDAPSRKRKGAVSDVAVDLSASAPESKRQNFAGTQEAQQAFRPQHGSSPAPAPCPCCSTFGHPTGLISDRFALSDVTLGSGQFGSVRECTDMVTGERLACKTVRKVPGNAATQGQELRNEVALMQRVTGHSGVAQLRAVFEDVQEVHLVMDLCAGGDLFEEVVRRQRFQEPDAAHLFAEVVRAVAFCHSRGVMHRDLKPENLLLTRRLQEGESVAEATRQGPMLKLADFGLAVPVAQGQVYKGMAGSPFYMAPEVLNGEYSLKADVWSLGVVLYILLCGSPPFWGETDQEVFKAILRGQPDLTSAPWNGISEEAKSLVSWLLTSDAACRPTAEKVLAHPWLVQHLSAGRPVRQAAAHYRSTAVRAL